MLPIPLDGMVLESEAMVNQAALTGESMPVRKTTGATVYAGTVVEEGECVLVAKAEGSANRYAAFPVYCSCCSWFIAVSAYNKNEIGNPFRGSLSHFFVWAILQQPS